MRKALLVLTAILAVAAAATAQQVIPKTESERIGAESYNKAVEAYAAGDYAASIPHFLAADSLIGAKGIVDRSKLQFALATAYLRSNQPGRALNWFIRVAENDSTYPLIHYHAAECARQAGQPEEALKHYRVALRDAGASEQTVIIQRMGEILEKRRDFQGAVNVYSQLLDGRAVPAVNLLRGQAYDRLAAPLDRAQEQNFDLERAVRSGDLNEQRMSQAIELREKALADYRVAAEDPKLASRVQPLIERSLAILQNNRLVVAEIRYQHDNEE